MKKLCRLLIIALLLFSSIISLPSCGNSDKSGFKKYESAGLKYAIPKNMYELNVPQEYADLAYGNDDGVEFMIYFYSAEELLTLIYIDKDSTSLEYADVFAQRNEYTNPEVASDFVREYDEEKRTATMSYIYLDENRYYYDYILRTDTNLYHITMNCPASIMDEYIPQFKKWEKYISAENI